MKLKLPAEFKASAPEVVVETVKGPEVTLTVNPPVEGPVIVLADVPEKVRFPPKVKSPDPVVIGPLFVV